MTVNSLNSPLTWLMMKYLHIIHLYAEVSFELSILFWFTKSIIAYQHFFHIHPSSDAQYLFWWWIFNLSSFSRRKFLPEFLGEVIEGQLFQWLLKRFMWLNLILFISVCSFNITKTSFHPTHFSVYLIYTFCILDILVVVWTLLHHISFNAICLRCWILDFLGYLQKQ